MKLLRTICVLGLALCLATSAYAGTQSVKISGDLGIRGIYRNQYDLGAVVQDTPRTGLDHQRQDWIMSTTEAQIDADLTDNVSAVVRLLNQRDWNVFVKGVTPGVTTLLPNGRGPYTENTNEFDVIVDLAYIELKEFLYSPLTLKIGRQDLWFGKGFIVGANQQNPGTNLTAPEYTAVNSFDAVRATLDYDPWTIDAVYANIYENAVQSEDDVNLLGVNIGYIFDSYNGEAEGYYWLKNDRQVATSDVSPNSDVHCIGLRGSADPIQDWTIAAEGAFQFGNAVVTDVQRSQRDREGWGFDVSAECRYFANLYAWKPVLTGEYVFYSGDEHASELDEAVVTGTTHRLTELDGTYTGWDPMYRGKFDTKYREFIGRYYATGAFPRRARLYQSSADASFTNQHQVLMSAAIMPMDSLTCSGKLGLFWLDEDISETFTNDYIGTELDLNLVWDYTEDVSFGLLGAWFYAGDLYDDEDNAATEIMSSVNLSF